MGTGEIPSSASGRALLRSTLWSLAGQVGPGLVGIVVLPYLVHGIGTDRFGVLSLSWMVVGYFSLFDFGTGRALTKLVADLLAARQRTQLATLIWTALGLMLLLGVAASLVALTISRWLVYSELKIPPSLQREALSAFYVLAV